LLLLLRRGEAILVGLPRDVLVVPVASGERRRRDSDEQRGEHDRLRAYSLHDSPPLDLHTGSGGSNVACMCSIHTVMSARRGRPSVRSSSATGWSPSVRRAPPSRMPTPSAPETNRVRLRTPSTRL